MRKMFKLIPIAIFTCAMVLCAFAATGCNGDALDDRVAELEKQIAEMTQTESDLRMQLAQKNDLLTAAQEEISELTGQIESKVNLEVYGTPDFFQYTLNDDDTYTVVGPVENIPSTVSTLVIPSRYEGKPVTRISSSSFRDHSQEDFDNGDSTFVLRGVYIPASIIEIGSKAFNRNSDLVNLVFGERNGMDLFFDGGVFGNLGIRFVAVPEGVTRIGDQMFLGCSELERVVFPTTAIGIGSQAFWCCNNLTLTLPDTLRAIGNEAFLNVNLQNFKIPSSIETIGYMAFDNFDSNKFISGELFIPNTCKYIGQYAFRAQTEITSITFEDPDHWVTVAAESIGAAEGTSIDLSDPIANVTLLSKVISAEYLGENQKFNDNRFIDANGVAHLFLKNTTAV